MLLSMPTICRPSRCRKRAVSLPISPDDPVITAIDIQIFLFTSESRPSWQAPQGDIGIIRRLHGFHRLLFELQDERDKTSFSFRHQCNRRNLWINLVTRSRRHPTILVVRLPRSKTYE